MRTRLCSVFALVLATLFGQGASAASSDTPAMPFNYVSLAERCDVDTGENCDTAAQVQGAGEVIADMLRNEAYASLDQYLEVLCSGVRLADGQPESLVFASGIQSWVRSLGDISTIRKQIAQWRVQQPQSLAAALTEAQFWKRRAWMARGNGYANSVTPEAWKIFHEAIAKSVTVLESSGSFASSCPLWHAMLIGSLQDDGADAEVVEAVYTEAVKRFPHAQQIHVAMGRMYMPRWGGSDAAFDQFARRAAKLSQASEGFGMYARLWWTAECNCDDGLNLAKNSTAPSWKDLKTGFYDLLKRYPKDVWNRNKFAALACRAGDGPTYSQVRRVLKTAILPDLWSSNYPVDVCDARFYKKT